MEITLPKLERPVYKKSGSRNSVTQLIAPQTNIIFDKVSRGKNYLIGENLGAKYLLINKAENASDGFEYVLLTDKMPTEEGLKNKSVTIKKWLKHPLLKDYSIEDVIKSWKDEFSFKEEDLDNGDFGLRQPQIAALHSILGHLKLPLDTANVIMPTGTGKTETMLCTLIAGQCKKLLVTVPSDSLRGQISNKFITLGVLKYFKVVGEKALFPIVGIIRNKFEDTSELEIFLNECNVVVTTMSWLSEQDSETKSKIASTFDNVFIDEAHHVKATSWNEFKNLFSKEKIIQFTATPFRNDGKRLDGKIIFNFPLKHAQKQGYYKKIKFIPISVYDTSKADAKIAELAIQTLREDIEKGFKHILMARCETKARANEVFQYYNLHTDLNPVILYSGAPDFKESYRKILARESKIIVCVDMLGEGFDLPELKIAAFHDIRKSLPITLQLAGRFTRTKFDEELGDAVFIANIADLKVREELADLYATDADWNEILPEASLERINDQIEFKDFIAGFGKLSDSNIPFQNIMPKLSTVVYKNRTTEWFPTNFKKAIPDYESFDFKFHDINHTEKVLVIVTGKKVDVDWIHNKEIYNIQWDIIIVFWDTRNNLLFINSSDNSSLYSEIAKAIIGDNTTIINGIDVFKCFYNIKRVKLQNVGLRQFLGKNIRFRMMVGADVAEALSLAERQRGEKAFVIGNGFEVGKPTNIGASYKGRIWTKQKGDLKSFQKWCLGVGNKLINPNINPNQILKETLIPELLTKIPTNVFPVWIDWDVDMYMETESTYKFIIDNRTYDLSNIQLCLYSPTLGGPLQFSINTDDKVVIFQLDLFEQQPQGGEPYPDFRITQKSSNTVEVRFGSKTFKSRDFFEKYIPTIWYADGSALTGNEYVELKQQIGQYPKDSIVALDWTGVNLSNESQHVQPKVTDSIQYHMIQKLKTEDNDFIYDDDYSGEIADIITIKVEPENITINLYHLKYALGGVVSSQIKNFYEVCGQAQKCVHWKHKDGREFINHLLKRETKSRNGNSCSRLEKGDIEDLRKLLPLIKNQIPVTFNIYIVQPGFSKASASTEILTLLGVTDTYIKEFSDINLKVISNL